MHLEKQLLGELEMSQVLPRVTVAVEKPEQPCSGRPVPHRTRPDPKGFEVPLRDPSGHFLQEPVCILDPVQELLRLLNSLREFGGTVSIDR